MNIRLKSVGPAWRAVVLAGMALVGLSGVVQAGGTIGWAAAVDQFSTEGVWWGRLPWCWGSSPWVRS